MRTLQYFQKKILIYFFAHENIKKRALKVVHNRPQTCFHSTGPAVQSSSELIFHIINMSQDPSVSLSVAQALCNSFQGNISRLALPYYVQGCYTKEKVQIKLFWDYYFFQID